jgi:hypothetical protein
MYQGLVACCPARWLAYPSGPVAMTTDATLGNPTVTFGAVSIRETEQDSKIFVRRNYVNIRLAALHSFVEQTKRTAAQFRITSTSRRI